MLDLMVVAVAEQPCLSLHLVVGVAPVAERRLVEAKDNFVGHSCQL